MSRASGAWAEETWTREGKRPLQGVLSRPAAGAARPGPGVVLLTGGVLPRIGPHRFYVKLARRLAGSGFSVLRFDFSGLSNPRDPVPRSPSHEERVHDGLAALDCLAEREGVESFALVGMCRSATPAFTLALRDERVSHGVFVNGHYLSSEQHEGVVEAARERFRFRHYIGRARRAASWRRLLTGKSRYGNLARVLGRRVLRGARRGPDTPADGETLWGRLRKRDMEALVVYAEGSSSYDVFETVHRPVLRRLGPMERLRVEFVGGSDHTLTLLSSQERAIDLVEGWLLEKTPSSRGPSKE